MPSHNNKADVLLNIDDDLDGVDDFLSEEPNPFEDDRPILSDEAPELNQDKSSANVHNTDFGTMRTIPPSYDETIAIDNENNGNISNSDRGNLPPGFVNFYSQYFQLSTETFKKRLLASLKFKPSIFSISNQKEIFGAVWITLSIILLKFIFPALISLIYDGIILGLKINAGNRNENFISLVHCFWLFGVYTFVIPLLSLQFIARDENSSIGENSKSPVGLITIYGYCNTTWVFVFPILDILKRFDSARYVTICEWVVAALGWLKMIHFMYFQICYERQGDASPKLTTSLLAVIALHTIFCVLVMLFLY
ncbi:hypothetical protein KAFR_0C03220 [Kazachstania africana CBS 2517]|uniref:Protein YIP n=1 Tax=Kazachstania africana (strain ATCC 22294 / BCRC 22015 / CBS 2517 / CECT 1963 / NBRC 1671 / NRRL Y-8276) TaxID=1071382 RepID=H2ASG4_KAZAF|nr:hypothetical protein KAFR_0C03220 [Kazachstania africana CBS 2517]CCF57314.1 hypothetical protein KAFR_0C03220 [Kazachstania africana CBS 2517]